jgi:hypothetical protein
MFFFSTECRGTLPKSFLGYVSARGKAAMARIFDQGLVMTDLSTDHGAVIVERAINAPLSRVYGAFADANQRASWSAPSETAVFIYDETMPVMLPTVLLYR